MADDPYDHLAAADPVIGGLVRRCGRPDPFVWSVGTTSTDFAALALLRASLRPSRGDRSRS